MTTNREMLESMLGTVRTLQIQLEQILGNEQATGATVGEIRNIAVLAEVQKLGGVVNSATLSVIARKYGKDPKGSAGYFKGDLASMIGIANGNRALTDAGVARITQANKTYGEGWLDRLPMDVLSDSHVEYDTIITF